MKKKLFIAILAVAVLCCVFGVAACNSGGGGSTGGETSGGGENNGGEQETAKVEGAYFLYENGAFDGDTYFTFSDGIWTNEYGESGNFTVTENSITLFVGASGGEKFAEGSVNQDTITLISGNESSTYRKNGSSPLKPSTVLEYALSADNAYYKVTGIGETDGNVVVPDTYKRKPVKEISADAFEDCDNITAVKIGANVNLIGEYAFWSCDNLKTVTMGDGVKTIAANAFKDCLGLVSVAMGKGVEVIGDNAFLNCGELKNLSLPDGITSVSNNAFDGCAKLEYKEYSNAYYLGNKNNHYVLLKTVKDTGIAACTVHENAKIIYARAFKNCGSLSQVTIGNGVIKIGNDAFYGCTDLTGVTMGDGVTSIGQNAFYNCGNLQNLTVSGSLTEVGKNAFQNCNALNFNEYGNACYLGNAENRYVILVKAKNTSVTECTVNANTKIIYDMAFGNCNSLESVVIPNGVVSIGFRAFWTCAKLKSVAIPESVVSISQYAFQNCFALNSATFNNAEGWSVGGQKLTAADLENPSTAATYLFKTYTSKSWIRS